MLNYIVSRLLLQHEFVDFLRQTHEYVVICQSIHSKISDFKSNQKKVYNKSVLYKKHLLPHHILFSQITLQKLFNPYN